MRVDTPPTLDGSITDPVWQLSSPSMDFTQFDPHEGARPTEITSVRILYDHRALYVGVICYDARPEGIVRQLSRRDRTTEADRFSVLIDSYFDRRTAFVFSTNVSGVQSDGVLAEDGSVYDITWDAVWSVKTRVYRDGWSAEFVIPFNALRFSLTNGEEVRFGMNFRRYISRKKETDEWVMVPRSDQGQVSHWGVLTGLRDITPPLHLEVLPYASLAYEAQSAATGHPRASRTTGLAGVDLKYGLTRNFTLDATVNPDFGQVEVDQAVLNLTVFETRFPEKRPFFLEGAQMFTFGNSYDNTPLALFFSRRIGKRPSGSDAVPVPPGGRVEENPLVTTILGAAKLTGRTPGGLTVAGLTAATDEEVARVQDATGNAGTKIRTEPRGLYSVARVKQDLAGGTWVGAMATLASRDQMRPAVSGGVDWNLRFADATHTADGYLAGSRSSSSQNGGGSAGRILVGRIAAEHWLYFASYDYATREFSPNDLGFFGQAHDRGGYVQLMYRENFGSGVFRRYAFSLVPEGRWNWDNVATLRQADLSFSGELTNFWKVTLGYRQALPAFDDAERGIIGLYRRPYRGDGRLLVMTDERQPMSATFSAQAGRDGLSGWNWLGMLNLTVRPVSWIELQPSATIQMGRRERAGVFSNGGIATTTVNGTRASLIAERDLDQTDLSFRGTMTFSRSVSLQFYGQSLLARGRYRAIRALTGPSTLVAVADPGTVYDFNSVTLRANILLRWEFLPGSALYLVWTQQREDDSGVYATSFGTRFGDAFALPHNDALLVKVSYWLGF